MTVAKYEDLRVWQAAKSASDEIGRLVRRPPLSNDFALREQLNGAVLSTLANIAEGFSRGGRKEFAQFVRIARGSNGEAKALLQAAEGRHYFDKDDFGRLMRTLDDIGRMLWGLEQRLRQPANKPIEPRSSGTDDGRRTTDDVTS